MFVPRIEEKIQVEVFGEERDIKRGRLIEFGLNGELDRPGYGGGQGFLRKENQGVLVFPRLTGLGRGNTHADQ